MLRPTNAWVYASLLLCGCPADPDEPEQTGPAPLIAADAWVAADASSDVFADHRPAQVMCDPSTYGSEDVGVTFEVETGECNYLTAEQPSLVDLHAGDTLEIDLLHYGLEAPMPAEAHAAVAVDGEVVWETTAAIPSPPADFHPVVEMQRDAPAGSTVQFHVHNHGVNSWVLGSITAVGTQ